MKKQFSLQLFLLIITSICISFQSFFDMSEIHAWSENDAPIAIMIIGSHGIDDGEFDSPDGVAVDSSGNIYVADTYNSRIQKFNSAGVFQFAFGSPGPDDGEFNIAVAVEVDSSGNIYVVDAGNHRIQKFNGAGVFQFAFGSFGSANGEFNFPTEIVVDSSGDIYVADPSNNRIQKFNNAGIFQVAFGSEGTNEGEFQFPCGVVVDTYGYIYVADTDNNRIQKFNNEGVFQFAFGKFGSADGEFQAPFGIEVDSRGNIYVADLDNYRIQKFDNEGVFQLSYGSQGSDIGEFEYVKRIALDSIGNIHVADTFNNRIQIYKFDRTGPTGSIIINAGATSTMTSTVNLTINATDALSSVTGMMVSEDTGFSRASWEAYSTSKTWTLSSGAGVKTVYIKFKDTYNTESIVYNDNITFGTIVPDIELPAVPDIPDTTSPVAPIITNIGLINNIPNLTHLFYYFTSQSPRIRGISEAGSIVHFKYITNDYTTTTNSFGVFEIIIPELPRQAVTLTYYAVDNSANQSVVRTLDLLIGIENFPNIEIIPSETPLQEDITSDSEQEETKEDPSEKTSLFTIEVVDQNGQILSNSIVYINNKKYTTDNKGRIYLEQKLDSNMKIYVDFEGKKVLAQISDGKIVVNDPKSKEETQTTSYLSYWWIITLPIIVVGGFLYAKKKN